MKRPYKMTPPPGWPGGGAFSRFRVSRQMALEVAGGGHALIYDDKSVGVDFRHGLAEGGDLVLIQAHAQHLHRLVGKAAVARPVGDTPAHLFHNIFLQLVAVLPGEDQHLHGDILLVEPIHKHGAQHRVDGGIEGHRQAEQGGAHHVQHSVEHQGELAHGALALLAQVHADGVQATGAAAAGEDEAPGEAVEDAAQHAARQLIVDNGGGGNGHDGHEKGIAGHANHHQNHEFPAQGLPGQHDQGDVHQHIQHARQVEGGGDSHPGQQRADDLAHAQHTAGVQVLGRDEQVDGHGGQQRAQHRHADAGPAVVDDLVKHNDPSRLRWKLMELYVVSVQSARVFGKIPPRGKKMAARRNSCLTKERVSGNILTFAG